MANTPSSSKPYTNTKILTKGAHARAFIKVQLHYNKS